MLTAAPPPAWATLTGAGLLLASLWPILSPVCRARDLPAAAPDLPAEMRPEPARDGL